MLPLHRATLGLNCSQMPYVLLSAVEGSLAASIMTTFALDFRKEASEESFIITKQWHKGGIITTVCGKLAAHGRIREMGRTHVIRLDVFRSVFRADYPPVAFVLSEG